MTKVASIEIYGHADKSSVGLKCNFQTKYDDKTSSLEKLVSLVLVLPVIMGQEVCNWETPASGFRQGNVL